MTGIAGVLTVYPTHDVEAGIPRVERKGGYGSRTIRGLWIERRTRVEPNIS